ncbi:ROK family protein [Cryobacterium lactosi]|uniref:ROK family protein n=1 Tax=Cryobacterium lactosi TaxID=1259202 RepID=A0A4R9BXT6_9MICO|nr:ROK family protein [Cryobacterium lactosi]TFD93061.1 ROK family protein [Cryobacterium lactosi]
MQNDVETAVFTIEVGGSSTQYCEVSGDELFPSSRPASTNCQWLLAAPGIVNGDHVRGAHHIGWGDVSASEQLNMSHAPLCSMNDAEAAALGEWYLRGSHNGRWLYIGLGTGVGSAVVVDGIVSEVDFSHATGFGPKICGGCGARGCLDAQIGGHALSNPLNLNDRERVLNTLTVAIQRLSNQPDAVVLAGGMSRKFPDLFKDLGRRIEAVVFPSAIELPMKSAAPWGLLCEWKKG